MMEKILHFLFGHVQLFSAFKSGCHEDHGLQQNDQDREPAKDRH